MCTVSWWYAAPDTYQLWFNRDEQRTRPLALAPALRSENGVTCLAPTDTKHHGTWIAVNQHGLTVCLLNHYASPAPSAPLALSRGALVLACAPAPDLDALHRVVTAPRWRTLPGFFLLALSSSGETRLYTWDTLQLTYTDAPVSPFTTSSFDSTRIISARLDAHQRLAASLTPPALCATFQDQHDPARPADSVLMSRPDATTVSQSRLEISPARIAFHYRAAHGPALLSQLWKTSELPLAGKP